MVLIMQYMADRLSANNGHLFEYGFIGHIQLISVSRRNFEPRLENGNIFIEPIYEFIRN